MKKLRKSTTDRKWDGVLGGIADYFSVDSTLIRLIFIALTIFSFGLGGLVIYIIAMVIMPTE